MKLTQTITAARTIEAPRQKVWEVFCRMMDWESWNPLVSRTHPPDGGVLGHGARFSLSIKLRPLGLARTIDAQVTELVPLEKLVWEGRWGGIRVRQEFTFRQMGSGCLVQSSEQLTGWALLWARLLYSPRGLSRQAAQWLQALAASCGTHSGSKAAGCRSRSGPKSEVV